MAEVDVVELEDGALRLRDEGLGVGGEQEDSGMERGSIGVAGGGRKPL
jgi:hypothetical protein